MWRTPDGWPLRTFAWPVEGAAQRGAILFQTGRGDVFEKYLELFSRLHRSGWSVTAFDWRGQGGSGRMSDNPHCGHIDDFGTYIGDLNAFFADWKAKTPGPHVVMGHSMGGHLVLRAIAESGIAPDAAILIAPMLGLKTPVGARLTEIAARIMRRLGNPARPAWKGNEKPNTTETRQSLLTHDAERYSDELFWQQAQPELLTGPPSWNWLVEAFASCRRLRKDADSLRRISTPILMLLADADGLVDPAAARAIAAELPDAQVERFGPESAHEILREEDSVRSRAIASIESFLNERVPTE